MNDIRIVLTKPGDAPLSKAFKLDADIPDEIAQTQITITAGSEIARGSVTVPLQILTLIMRAIMEADEKRTKTGIVIPKPRLVVPGKDVN